VRLSGSDLHDEGLGAAFVDFTKPPGGGGMYRDKTNFTAVLKPENRAIEKRLFGTEDTSLASRINVMAGLQGEGVDVDRAIGRIKMQTHAAHGSLIEFIEGTQSRDFDRLQPPSDKMREAMVFAWIAGLSDVHKDNVIWRDGRPHLIDADNALNNARLGLTTDPEAEVQSGFSEYSEGGEETFREEIKGAPEGETDSLILQALANVERPVPIITAIKKAFEGQKGRVVPIATSSWANVVTGYYGLPPGLVNDAPGFGTTRWAVSNKMTERVPDGTPSTPQPGLRGEVGEDPGGHNFQAAEEARGTKANLDVGQIPFYEYEYDTGHVLHNGTVIWHGEALARALELLLNKFPHQRDLDIGEY